MLLYCVPMSDYSSLSAMPADDDSLLATTRRVLRVEAEALTALADRLDGQVLRALQVLRDCRGRVVVSGMGKSGHIAGKIAATLASTGTPAFFLHPAEACHGDLGMLTQDDVLLALSYSGESDELLALLPYLRRQKIPLVVLTGNPGSSLAKAAEVVLDAGVREEACPLGLAPTTSTTAALALGDALAVALLEWRGFGADDFALSHPSGRLGRRLLIQVADLMHAGEHLPMVRISDVLPQALEVVTRKRLGFAAVLDDKEALVGIFTDGDLRRAVSRFADLRSVTVGEVMTPRPRCVQADTLAVEAMALMEQAPKITSLLVLDEQQQLVGAIHLHDLLNAGLL